MFTRSSTAPEPAAVRPATKTLVSAGPTGRAGLAGSPGSAGSLGSAGSSGSSAAGDPVPVPVLAGSGPGADVLLEAAGSVPPNLPCRVQDADLWFAETPEALNRAKEFCATCPVRLACLAGAIARREPWGVWGGEIFEHGAVIARKRPRGRPRKDAHEVAA